MLGNSAGSELRQFKTSFHCLLLRMLYHCESMFNGACSESKRCFCLAGIFYGLPDLYEAGYYAEYLQNKSAFVSSVVQWLINKIMQNRYTFLKTPGVYKKENEEVPAIPVKLRQLTGFIRPGRGIFPCGFSSGLSPETFFIIFIPMSRCVRSTACREFSCVSVNT